MPGPAPQSIHVTASQRRVLEQLIRRGTSPQQQVHRAQMILAAADGANNEQVGRQVGGTDDTVRAWRRRWCAARETLLAAEAEGGEMALEPVVVGVLADEPRAGAPATFTAEQVCQIMALACTPPEAVGRPIEHWTTRELADEAVQQGIVPRISPSSVDRFLKGGRRAAPSQPVLVDPGAR